MIHPLIGGIFSFGGTLKNELIKLIALSRVDAEIDAINEDKEELPQTINELQNQINALESQIAEKKQEIGSWESEKKQKEIEFAEQKDWVDQSESRLKEIKNMKEYQASLKEIAQAKKVNSEIENALLELMTKIEEDSKQLSEIENELSEKKKPLIDEIEEKKNQVAEIDGQIQEKINQRSEKEKELNESILKRYKVIKARLSPAVAQAINGVCLECNMNIPPPALYRTPTI